MTSLAWPFYLLIPKFIFLHLFISPYTKVEESFNIQAIHDILIHGIPTENVDQFLTSNYDHVSFPGSVPRTFAGALVLSGLSRPWVALLSSTSQLQLLGEYIPRLNLIGIVTNHANSQRGAWPTQCGRSHRIWKKRAESVWN